MRGILGKVAQGVAQGAKGGGGVVFGDTRAAFTGRGPHVMHCASEFTQRVGLSKVCMAPMQQQHQMTRVMWSCSCSGSQMRSCPSIDERLWDSSRTFCKTTPRCRSHGARSMHVFDNMALHSQK